MADRGRLFYASDGLLWEVDPTADISGEPAQADLQPVRMGELAAEAMELDQQADDGTDRVFIRGSDGAIKAEVFFDGTNTVINPLTGSVDVQGALATESLNFTPTGATVGLSGNQTIPDDSVTKIAFAQAVRDPDGLLNASNNSIDVPSGVSFGKFAVSFNLDVSTDIDLFDIRQDGSGFAGQFAIDVTNAQGLVGTTAWVPVSSGESYTARLWHVTGSSVTLSDTNPTFMEAWFV